jgi:hypothetical protein
MTMPAGGMQRGYETTRPRPRSYQTGNQ